MGAWNPWYDKCFGFVIRAETEQRAREIADADAGDENREENHPWLDPEQSTCTELTAEGKEEQIIKDFNAA